MLCGGEGGFDVEGVVTAVLFQGKIDGTVKLFRTIFPVALLVKFSRLKCREQT